MVRGGLRCLTICNCRGVCSGGGLIRVCKCDDLREFLLGKTQPALDTCGQLRLAAEIVRHMQQGAGWRYQYSLCSKLLNCLGDHSPGRGEVGEPDVASFDASDTEPLSWLES